MSDAAVHAVANLAAIAAEKARAEGAASRVEAARQNEVMKATLLDALAHEFTTPLTSIKAAASSILDEERSTQQELLTIIEEEQAIVAFGGSLVGNPGASRASL